MLFLVGLIQLLFSFFLSFCVAESMFKGLIATTIYTELVCVFYFISVFGIDLVFLLNRVHSRKKNTQR